MKDSDLNTLFKNLRRAESKSAPPFERLARTPAKPTIRSFPWLVPAGMVALAACLAVFLVIRPGRDQSPADMATPAAFDPAFGASALPTDFQIIRHSSDTEAIVRVINSEWHSPTAFLLNLETTARDPS